MFKNIAFYLKNFFSTEAFERYTEKGHHYFVIDRISLILATLVVIPLIYNIVLGTFEAVVGTLLYWLLIIVVWWINRKYDVPNVFAPIYLLTLFLVIFMMVYVDGYRSSTVLIFPALIIVSGFFIELKVYGVTLIVNFLVLILMALLEYNNIITNEFENPITLIYIFDIIFINFLIAILMYLVLKYIGFRETKLKLANKTKDRFLNIVAHDLKSPFQSLIGISEYLHQNFDDLSSEEQKNSLDVLRKGIKNQYYLLEDLLHWGKLQSNTSEVEFEDHNIKSILDETLNSISILKIKKDIKIINNLNAEINVVCDKTLISTVFRNLITNSLKFTKSGGEINISAVKNENYTEIEVSDTGVGMSKSQIDDILLNDKSLTTKGLDGEIGTGLGLHLVRDILKVHNAKFEIESEIGKGTRFILTFEN